MNHKRHGVVERLHRYHCSVQATRLQMDLPGGQLDWRAEGSSYGLDAKAKIAHRLALCWNICEGMPSELLESGLMLEVFQAIEDGDLPRAQAAVGKIDHLADDENGRPHDCKRCLAKSEADDDFG